jgi:hypothetical protein
VQTNGSHVALENVTIDTTELSRIMKTRLVAGEGVPECSSVLLGFYANGWAFPWDSAGKRYPFSRHRTFDASLKPDEHIRLRSGHLVNVPRCRHHDVRDASAVRDVVVEDVRRDAFNDPSAVIFNDIEYRPTILERTQKTARAVTDDNLIVEWRVPIRYP